jgi:hypothetical protein
MKVRPRILSCVAALVVCATMTAPNPAGAQGATTCDSPCKVIPLPLAGPRGAVCDSPCKFMHLPLVTQTTVTSQTSLPFVVDTVSAESLDRIAKTRPRWVSEVDRPATITPVSPQPIYPGSLRVKKVEGAFTARFIVDTTGRIEVASFQVVKRGHPLFIAAVRDVLPLMRFIPAEVAGVKVRQWVERTFPFTLPH